MILYDVQSKASSNYDVNNIALKAFQVYKLRFYGIGFKSFSPKVDKICVDGVYKTVIFWGKAKTLSTILELYVLPLQNPIPIAILIGGSALLTALGLTLAILNKVEDISGIVYLSIFSITGLTIIYRKEIKKVLKR